MKNVRAFVLTFFLSFASISLYFCQNTPVVSAPPYPATNKDGDPLLVVFEGRTPCANCQKDEKVKIVVALYQNRETNRPGTYWLGLVFVGKGNERTEIEGAWEIKQGIKGFPGTCKEVL